MIATWLTEKLAYKRRRKFSSSIQPATETTATSTEELLKGSVNCFLAYMYSGQRRHVHDAHLQSCYFGLVPCAALSQYEASVILYGPVRGCISDADCRTV